MVNARPKTLMRGTASFTVKAEPDGGLRVAVRVDRAGAKALRKAFGALLKDLDSAEQGELVKMAQEMR